MYSNSYQIVKGRREFLLHFLGENQNSPADVSDWVSTGSSLLDLAISNKAHGGVPVRKITEINGSYTGIFLK